MNEVGRRWYLWCFMCIKRIVRVGAVLWRLISSLHCVRTADRCETTSWSNFRSFLTERALLLISTESSTLV